MAQTNEQSFDNLLAQAELLRQLHQEKDQRTNEPKRPADNEPPANRAQVTELCEPEAAVDFGVIPEAEPAEQLEVQLSEATEEPKKKSRRSKKSKKAKKAKRTKKATSKKGKKSTKPQKPKAAPAKRKSRGPRPKTIKVLGQEVPNEVGSLFISQRLNRVNQIILSCQKLGNIKGIDYAQTNEIMQEELAHAVRQIHQRVKVNKYKYTHITKLYTVDMPDRLTFERDEFLIEPRTPRPPVQEDFDEIDLQSPSLFIPKTPCAEPDPADLSESYHF